MFHSYGAQAKSVSCQGKNQDHTLRPLRSVPFKQATRKAIEWNRLLWYNS